MILAIGLLPAILPLPKLPHLTEPGFSAQRFIPVWRALPVSTAYVALVFMQGGEPIDTWPAFVFGGLAGVMLALERGLDYLRYGLLFLSLPNVEFDVDLQMRRVRIASAVSRLAVVYGAGFAAWSTISGLGSILSVALTVLGLGVAALSGLQVWRVTVPAARRAGDEAKPVIARITSSNPATVAIHHSGPGAVCPDDPTPLLERFASEEIATLLILRRLGDAESSLSANATYAIASPMMRGLDAFLQPEIKAIFYAGDGAQNAQFIRFTRFAHICVAQAEWANVLARPTHSMRAYDAILAPNAHVTERWKISEDCDAAPLIYNLEALTNGASLEGIIAEVRRAKGLKVAS